MFVSLGWNFDNVGDNKVLTSLRNLTPSVTYAVRVAAVNSAGEGPPSKPVRVKMIQGGDCVA